MPNNKCPICGKHLKYLLYTEYGRKVWNGEQWKEDESAGAIEFSCPECDRELDCEDLEKMGVI